MNLIVEFSNLPMAEFEMNYTGELLIRRRVVMIPLTESQVALLTPRPLGEIKIPGQEPRQLYEARRIICAQNDGEEKG